MKAFTVVAMFLAAFLCSLLGLGLVLPVGLVVHEYVIFPLAVCIAALLAALSTSSIDNRMGHIGVRQSTRPRLLSVIAAAEFAAALFALVVLREAELRRALFGPLIDVAAVAAVVLALSATTAALQFRQPLECASDDRRLVLVLVAAALLLVPSVIYVASLFGHTGA